MQELAKATMPQCAFMLMDRWNELTEVARQTAAIRVCPLGTKVLPETAEADALVETLGLAALRYGQTAFVSATKKVHLAPICCDVCNQLSAAALWWASLAKGTDATIVRLAFAALIQAAKRQTFAVHQKNVPATNRTHPMFHHVILN